MLSVVSLDVLVPEVDRLQLLQLLRDVYSESKY